MNDTNDLMSFLESASRHTPVNQERLSEITREEVRQEAEERLAAALQPTRTQVNEELIQYAMSSLGLSQSSNNQEESAQETLVNVDDQPVHDSSPEPQVETAPETEEENIPEIERPISQVTTPLIREELVRFSDAEWFEKIQEKTIILAGVGGIGSNMAVILAKLNPCSIYIFDFDNVDATNIAGQFYSNEDIGKHKVDALAASIVKYTNYSSVFAINRPYTRQEDIVADIMVCGFDNMEARRVYFNSWKDHVLSTQEENRGNCLFIDGRLTADEFQIFCMTGEDDFYMKEYAEHYLFYDYEAQSEVCSYKQTGFLANMIGSFMVNLIVNFCANQVNPRRNMTLPFMTSYRSSMMFLDFKR